MKVRDKLPKDPPPKGPHQLQRYPVPEVAVAIVRTIMGAVEHSPDRALALVDTERRLLGVVLDPAEYARLKALADLLKSPDIQSKLAGTYKPDPALTVTLEEIFAR